MKQKLMPLYDKIMLRKRNVIESVNDMLKNVAQIVHTRHRKKRNLLLSFALESESSNKKSETCVKPRFKVGKRRHLAHGLPSSNKKKRNLLLSFALKSLSFALKSERGDSNARPLRPERSALPTALLSDFAVQSYKHF